METRTGNSYSPARLLPVGDTAWTVEFGDCIRPEIHSRVLGLAAALEQARKNVDSSTAPLTGIVDVVPTFRSLTVHFDPMSCNGEQLGENLMRLAGEAGIAKVLGRQWRIPVCFDDEFAPDLNDLAQTKGLARDAVVELMTTTGFQVYMIGFMPGFPYMGGLPAELHMPRLSSPRKAVPERSLAVAGEMCSVYPWESPGGWRLLGRTPIPMFSAIAESPSLLASGDRVRWQAIDRATYLDMEAAAKAGAIDFRSLLVPAEGVLP